MEKNLEKKLEHTFKNILHRANEIYFRTEDVFDFLNWCDENNIMVVGIEGFKLEQNFLIPRLDSIADFSSGTENIENWNISRMHLNQAARNFFKESQVKGLVFNFVLKEPC